MTPMKRTIFQLLTAAVALGLLPGSFRAAGPKFYPDDPIQKDVERQDASRVAELDGSQLYDAIENSVLGAGERAYIRALNVNTIDEVPDSSWFTNRAGARAMTVDEVVKGADQSTGPAPGVWMVTGKKTEGVTPGLTITDSTAASVRISAPKLRAAEAIASLTAPVPPRAKPHARKTATISPM